MFRSSTAVTLLILAACSPAGADATAQVPTDGPRAVLVVRSDPAGAAVEVEGLVPAAVSPDTLVLAPGDWTMRLSLERFQPLTHGLTVAPGSVISLEFIMLQAPPEIPAPEMIGLEYEPVAPRRDPMEAYRVRRRYYNLVETFIVFPLAPGIIGKAAFVEDTGFPADALLYSGLALVAASAVTAELMFKKSRKDIDQHNLVADARNAEAETHNRDVDRALSAWHDQAVAAWQEAVADRGRVEVAVVWPPPPGAWWP